jgi:putative FmdB family regulatory protein
VPTYQYRCTACSEDLEAVQSFSDAALTECPACGGPLRKIFGSVGVVFKGSGFYKTDSRAGGKGATKERTKESVGASEATGSGGSNPGGSGSGGSGSGGDSASSSTSSSSGGASSGSAASTSASSGGAASSSSAASAA